MKKIFLAGLCMMMLMLNGCGSKATKGEVVSISVEELKTKMDKKESFAVIFTQPTCAYCKKVMTMLDEEYLDSHVITIYDVVLDREAVSAKEFQAQLDLINEYFPQMEGTPDLYNVKAGEIISQFDANNIDMFDATKFNEWVVENKLL